jgi:hypothetical protein
MVVFRRELDLEVEVNRYIDRVSNHTSVVPAACVPEVHSTSWLLVQSTPDYIALMKSVKTFLYSLSVNYAAQLAGLDWSHFL